VLLVRVVVLRGSWHGTNVHATTACFLLLLLGLVHGTQLQASTAAASWGASDHT